MRNRRADRSRAIVNRANFADIPKKSAHRARGTVPAPGDASRRNRAGAGQVGPPGGHRGARLHLARGQNPGHVLYAGVDAGQSHESIVSRAARRGGSRRPPRRSGAPDDTGS